MISGVIVKISRFLWFFFVITLIRGENDDWRIKFRYNLDNSGQTPYIVTQKNHVLFSAGIGRVAHSTSTVVDGLLYVGSDQGLFAINIEDGSMLWMTPIPPIGYSSPLVIPQPDSPGRGMIIVGGLDGCLYAFNEKGNQLWQTIVMAFGGVSASPTFHVGDHDSHDVTLYLVGNRISEDNKEQTETGLWAIDGITGASRWFFKVCVDSSVHDSADDAAASSLTIDPTCAVGIVILQNSINPTTSHASLLLYSSNTHLTAFQLSMYHCCKDTDGGIVYFASTCDNTIYAIDPGNDHSRGTPDVRWQFSPPSYHGPYAQRTGGPVSWTSLTLSSISTSSSSPSSSSSSKPPPPASLTLFVGRADGMLFAIDASIGTMLWSFRTDGPIISTPAFVASPPASSSYVVVASQDGNIYSLDARTGTLKWTFKYLNDHAFQGAYQMGLSFVSSPSFGLDETIYLGTSDGHVLALACGCDGIEAMDQQPQPQPPQPRLRQRQREERVHEELHRRSNPCVPIVKWRALLGGVGEGITASSSSSPVLGDHSLYIETASMRPGNNTRSSASTQPSVTTQRRATAQASLRGVTAPCPETGNDLGSGRGSGGVESEAAMVAFRSPPQPTVQPTEFISSGEQVAEVAGIFSSRPWFLKTRKPTNRPTHKPSHTPSKRPTRRDPKTRRPSAHPSHKPSFKPSRSPTIRPTHNPSDSPSKRPTRRDPKTRRPSAHPSHKPSFEPSRSPTIRPTHAPSRKPTRKPPKFVTAQLESNVESPNATSETATAAFSSPAVDEPCEEQGASPQYPQYPQYYYWYGGEQQQQQQQPQQWDGQPQQQAQVQPQQQGSVKSPAAKPSSKPTATPLHTSTLSAKPSSVKSFTPSPAPLTTTMMPTDQPTTFGTSFGMLGSSDGISEGGSSSSSSDALVGVPSGSSGSSVGPQGQGQGQVVTPFGSVINAP